MNNIPKELTSDEVDEILKNELPESREELEKLYEKVRRNMHSGHAESQSYKQRLDFLRSIEFRLQWESVKEAHEISGEAYKTGRKMFWLAFGALSISIVSLFFAYQQFSLVKKQFLPQFEINTKIENPNTPKASESIIIENKGALCYAPRFHLVSFIDVSMTQNKFTKVFRIPLENYLSWRILIDGREDNIIFSDIPPKEHEALYGGANYNRSELNNLGREFDDLVAKGGKGIGFILVTSFIKINYQDLLGEYRNEYYMVSFIEVKKIDKDSWENISRTYEQRPHFILFSNQNAKWLLDHIDTLDPNFTYPQVN